MKRIEAEIAGWPGVSVDSRPYGGYEFLLGTEPIGYLHDGPVLDVLLPEAIRSALTDRSQSRRYERSPNSDWLLFHVRSGPEADHATWLVRLAYLYRASVASNREELAAIDPDRAVSELRAALDTLETNETHRESFDALLYPQGTSVREETPEARTSDF